MRGVFASWGLIVLSALLDSYAAFVVKMKFNALGPIDFSSVSGFLRYMGAFVRSPLLASAVLAFVTAPALWFLALNRLELSIGYPALVGFHLIFIMIFGLFFLGEPVTANKLIGAALVMISFYFLNR